MSKSLNETLDRSAKALLERTTHGRQDFETLVIVPVFAVIVALFLGGLIMLATNVDLATIGKSYVALARGSVGSLSALSETLTAAIPLVLAGLGLALGFRRRAFQYRSRGSTPTRWHGGRCRSFMLDGLPWVIHLPVALLAGALVGALYASIAGWLKAATGAHEVISTIMLNLISFRLLDYLLRQPFIQKEGRADPIQNPFPRARNCRACSIGWTPPPASCRVFLMLAALGRALALVPLQIGFASGIRRKPARRAAMPG